MTTLENSYCVPSTVEEWDMLYPNANWAGQYPCEHSHVYVFGGGHKYLFFASWPNEDPNKTEIPVPRFLDLMHDRIVPWRLEEFGFDTHPQGLPRFAYKIKKAGSIVVVFQNENPNPAIYIMSAKDVTPVNLTTFTDLMTLIRMLTPPSK